MRLTVLRIAAVLGIGGSLMAVAVPAFLGALLASKLTEALDGLDRVGKAAVASSSVSSDDAAFPPSVELTPAEVPRGVRVLDPQGTWDHLTWRALGFRVEIEHAFAFSFDSSHEMSSGVSRFAATAHGDLDGDGTWSTFQIQGERIQGQPARVLPGLLVTRELE